MKAERPALHCPHRHKAPARKRGARVREVSNRFATSERIGAEQERMRTVSTMAEKLLLCYLLFCRQIQCSEVVRVNDALIKNAADFFDMKFSDLQRARVKLMRLGLLVKIEAGENE